MAKIRSNIPKLDLHGIRHHEVPRMVDIFLYENIHSPEMEIITGYSKKMKEIVLETVADYGFKCEVGDPLGINQGFIKITT